MHRFAKMLPCQVHKYGRSSTQRALGVSRRACHTSAPHSLCRVMQHNVYSSPIGWRFLQWEQWNHISSLPTLREDEIQHPEETPLHWMKIPILFCSSYIGWRFLFFSALPILDEDSYSFLPFLYWMKIPLRGYLISPCDECIIRSILLLIVIEEPTCTICAVDRSSQLSTASPFALPCHVCVDLDVPRPLVLVSLLQF
jgi:hypothetical protein